MISVAPTWLDFIQITGRGSSSSPIASMIPRAYGTRSVRHGPGSELEIRESTRFASAQAEIESFAGSARPLRNARAAFREPGESFADLVFDDFLGIGLSFGAAILIADARRDHHKPLAELGCEGFP